MKKLITKLAMVMLAVVGTAAFTACGGDEPTKSKFDDMTLKVGDTRTLYGSDDNDWSSDNSDIATIDGKTLVVWGQAKLDSSTNNGWYIGYVSASSSSTSRRANAVAKQ